MKFWLGEIDNEGVKRIVNNILHYKKNLINKKMKKTKPLYSNPCSLGEVEEQNKETTLKDVYSLIAELWSSPAENNKNREKIYILN